MAGADRLKEKILEEARQKARNIVDQAKSQADSIIKAAREEAEEKAGQILAKAREEAGEIRRRMLASAQLEARKTKLRVKQEMIEKAFSEALDRLISMPSDEYEKMLAEMIAESVSTGNEEIILSHRDKKRLSGNFLQLVNSKIAARGITGNVRLSEETGDFLGGFILRSGNVEINNSFEAVIRMRREELEPDIVKILFRD